MSIEIAKSVYVRKLHAGGERAPVIIIVSPSAQQLVTPMPRSTQPGYPSVGRRNKYQRKLGSKQAHRVMNYPVSVVSQCWLTEINAYGKRQCNLEARFRRIRCAIQIYVNFDFVDYSPRNRQNLEFCLYIFPNSQAVTVWLSGNALASINVVALRQTRLVPRWVTVC